MHESQPSTQAVFQMDFQVVNPQTSSQSNFRKDYQTIVTLEKWNNKVMLK